MRKKGARCGVVNNNNNNTKTSIAPYSRALRHFTIKCLNLKNTRAKLQIKISLKKISFKIALKRCKILITFYILWKIISKFRGCRPKKHDHHKIFNLDLGVTNKFLADDYKFLGGL